MINELYSALQRRTGSSGLNEDPLKAYRPLLFAPKQFCLRLLLTDRIGNKYTWMPVNAILRMTQGGTG